LGKASENINFFPALRIRVGHDTSPPGPLAEAVPSFSCSNSYSYLASHEYRVRFLIQSPLGDLHDN
jgi:hypothetical protein